MNIEPLYARVIIKSCDENKITAGGIVIPNTVTEKPIQGSVITVGEGKTLRDET